ncbi:hypothetical protein AU500_10735 [Lonsdalea populi]|uniref:Uncharacterized protein n=2 Tax=Lonsdalea TaxID=1082702 RepID=A0ACD1JEC6_9GAMM|nr:hypothetical protein AU499_13255 [Lonsdalea populi]RAT14561.1 hypothetical protein AU485_05875 [Lonsdalea quercina]RAT19845.1 hypothetical protein AU487_09845 [Lonsdalea populi]RAT23951.1 hypothetical protein AU489_10580 [Lonsdalea populi]RAT24587.1 hypothetical protein AU488_07410 [Lonsdalea populi]
MSFAEDEIRYSGNFPVAAIFQRERFYWSYGAQEQKPQAVKAGYVIRKDDRINHRELNKALQVLFIQMIQACFRNPIMAASKFG